MTQRTYFISPDRALGVANDNRAVPPHVHHLPSMMQTGIRHNGPAEMVLFVEAGIVEAMVGGAAGIVGHGTLIRIPPGATYAFRNAGDETVRLVSGPCPRASDSAA
mgnify:FL=1